MARPQHRTRPAGTYFVTSCAREHMRLLQNPAVATIVEDAIFRYRDQGYFLVHRHVVMADHFHAIVTPGATTTLEKVMQVIKGGSSYDAGKQFGKKLPLWQTGFTEHQIRDAHDFDTHVKYIDENPVKARMVERPGQYEWSSARGRRVLDAWPPASAPKGAPSNDDSADLKVRPFRGVATKGSTEDSTEGYVGGRTGNVGGGATERLGSMDRDEGSTKQ